MLLDKKQLAELSQLAIESARLAAQHIKSSLSTEFEVSYKDGKDSLAAQVVTEVDRQSEAIIIDTLSPSLEEYDLALLSEELIEEQGDNLQRLTKDYFWCIDPIDGTLAFTEKKPGFAVSVALVSKIGEPIIGVVLDPYNDVLYSAIKGQGAYKNDEPWQANSRSKNSFNVPSDRSLLSRSNYSDLSEALDKHAKTLGCNYTNISVGAGAVLNACSVIESPPGIYFKPPKPTPGGGSLWDFAATACLAIECGIVVCDFESRPLDLNRADSTFMNHRGVIFATDQASVDFIRSLGL